MISPEPNFFAAPAECCRRLRVAILDDHPVTAVGLATCLRPCADLEVVLSETAVDRFLDELPHHRCNAVVVDYNLPNAAWDGMNLIRRLRRLDADMAIITLSSVKSHDAAYPAFRAGANGYLCKADPTDVIPAMIRATVAQPAHFHYSMNGEVRHGTPQSPDALLSASEIEVLRLIARGLPATQIADRLSRSKKTVSTHKRSAMRKLGLADDLTLALYLKERFGLRAGYSAG
jgi:DNA-binding NarL/FixJ family response regulator